MEKFDIEVNELELKYDANEVCLSAFNQLSWSEKPESYAEAHSWDIYFSADKAATIHTLPFEFMRLRLGKKPELTIKIKKDGKNNNSRIEIDIPLDPNASSNDLNKVVSEYCKQFNFVENFRIFKYCSIFFYEKIDTVYYVTYDEEMKEIGRFLEIERRKDVPCESEDEAWELVKSFEQKFSIFGITPQHRMRRSQWEMNRK
jgi:adenylate cyclase class IV